MGIKAFNHGDDFVNKFIRAAVSDSTGLDAATPYVAPTPVGLTASGGIVTATGVNVTGIVTAASFQGSGADLTNLPASGDSNDITASLFI